MLLLTLPAFAQAPDQAVQVLPHPAEHDLIEFNSDEPPLEGVERPGRVAVHPERTTWLPEEGQIRLHGHVLSGHPIQDFRDGWVLQVRQVRLDECDDEQLFQWGVPGALILVEPAELGIQSIQIDMALLAFLETDYTSWTFTLVDLDRDAKVKLGQVVTSRPTAHPECLG